MTNQTRATYLRDLLLLTVFVGILFSLFLGTRPLVSPDEGRYSEIPRQMLLHHDFVTPRINNIKYFEKPPLFYWMQAGSIKLFGMNEWAFRLSTALMGLLGCLLTYFAGRKLFNRQTGLLAGGILATSALYFGLARFVTLDMTLSVLMSASLLSFAISEKTKDRRYLWGVYLFAALATITKGFIGFILPGMIIAAWIAVNNQWRELKHYKLFTGTLLFLAVALPWHILAELRNPEFLRYYVLDQQILRYFTPISGREQAIWFLPSVLIGGFMPWIVWLPQSVLNGWRAWRQHNDQLMSLLILWPTLVFLLFWFSKSQLSPYILPMFPAMALLVANYLDQSLRSKKSEWWPLIGFSIMTVAVCAYGMIRFKSADPTLLISFCCLLATAIITIFLSWEKGLKSALYALVIGFSIFLLSLNFSLPKYDTRSIKPLISLLKPILTKNDQVLSFHYLYMELPVYLNRNVTIVQYYDELKYGIQHGDVSDVWITNKQFWQHWTQPKRQFVFMSIIDYRKFIKQHKYPLYLLGKTRTNVLVANQDIKL